MAEIAAHRTPLSGAELAEALRAGHELAIGQAPSYARLGIAWSQVMHETGRTASCWNHNLGNIMMTSAHPGDWHRLNTGAGEPRRYRSYESATAGAADLWSLLERRYPAALEQFDAGDPAAAAAALKAGGYFQAPTDLYARALDRYFDEYRRIFPPPPEPTGGDTVGDAGLVLGVALALGAARLVR